jgi:hypothetical protein
MHYQTVIRIPGKHIGNNLAKSSREETSIHIPDGLVYIFLAGRDSTLKVSGRMTHLD